MPDDVIVDVAVGGRAARDEHNEDDAQHLCHHPSCRPRSVSKLNILCGSIVFIPLQGML